MAKRPCISDYSPRVSKRDYDRFNTEALLESLFAISDSALIDASYDELLESRSTDSDQIDFIQRALHLGSVLLEAGKRSVRKRSCVHNAFVWPLPPDLTIKVFSMLDTANICTAAATCSFFQKCAKDPLCYANIDLATLDLNIDDDVVSTIIQRAGNVLHSFRLGVLPTYHTTYHRDASGNPWWTKHSEQGKMASLLTSSCLSSLSANGGALRSHLRRLHLYNIEVDDMALLESLSVCPSLVDLEIVGLDVGAGHTVESVSRHCRLIERFIFDILETDQDCVLKNSTCKEFVLNCPKVTTLALKGGDLDDDNALVVVKGLHELKYVDFSTSSRFTGAFLKKLRIKGGGHKLEVMILRDCIGLDKVEVEQFMEALLAGEFKPLRHLDISNTNGLANNGLRSQNDRRVDLSSILINQLLKQRPHFCLIAEFPPFK